MKNGKVFFNPIDGSAPLSISWTTGPKGDAVEANNELGVGFFSQKGDLLGVIFDDVYEKEDHQVLEFDQCRIELSVKSGKIAFSVDSIALKANRRSNRKKKRKAA